MDALGCLLVDASYEILVDFLGHERNHRRRRLGNRHQRRVKRHVGVHLILLHPLGPEPLAAPSHVPVAHVINEILKGSRCLRDPVICQVIVHLFHRGI